MRVKWLTVTVVEIAMARMSGPSQGAVAEGKGEGSKTPAKILTCECEVILCVIEGRGTPKWVETERVGLVAAKYEVVASEVMIS